MLIDEREINLKSLKTLFSSGVRLHRKAWRKVRGTSAEFIENWDLWILESYLMSFPKLMTLSNPPTKLTQAWAKMHGRRSFVSRSNIIHLKLDFHFHSQAQPLILSLTIAVKALFFKLISYLGFLQIK